MPQTAVRCHLRPLHPRLAGRPPSPARRFDLWNKLRQLSGLVPRKDKPRGYGPEVILGQHLYPLCSGGECLSDSEAHRALLRHQPEGRNAPQLFAVSRRREGLFDRSGFIACDDAQTDAVRVWPRHGPGRPGVVVASG
ncbi:MAG: hypothetical protein N3I86_06740 [Verrucomicrobiae bacterium]|nr:hypothetical protein [Verrucomicrobiae bacterium]